MANANSAKGNPASHRMSNPNNKLRRVRNSAKNSNKNKHDGNVGRSNQNNLNKNNKLHDLKVENFGLGQREVRRILTGKNTSHNLTDDQVRNMTLIGHSFTTIMNNQNNKN
ncbi:hypothetical protein U27_02625 [Candidatus Vecturithrix granuli]|uniref:Uncharacterized protein n=1 Tax=Vecturithrix granuli TaxID=1499967 RepID=A0A081CB37_VECG1|nr:hypothetical protein U27_02625 [Candidatus Vecturithrix granuli]